MPRGASAFTRCRFLMAERASDGCGVRGVAAVSAKETMDGTNENPILYFESDGTGPHYHVCGEEKPLRIRTAREWLDRQIMIGGVTPEERRAVERMLEEIE
jgi:hypothetical protein